MNLDFNSKIDFVDQHTRYMDILYKTDKEVFDKKNANLKNVIPLLETLDVPLGYIIEAGVWKGDIYKIFQTYFGADRCVGFDIEKYIEDSSIIYGDFRKIHVHYNIQCSLFFNGLGAWKHNRSSKQSGLDYAVKNLKVNGYYLDPTIPNDDSIEMPSCFEKITTDKQFFLVYRKLHNDI